LVGVGCPGDGLKRLHVAINRGSIRAVRVARLSLLHSVGLVAALQSRNSIWPQRSLWHGSTPGPGCHARQARQPVLKCSGLRNGAPAELLWLKHYMHLVPETSIRGRQSGGTLQKTHQNKMTKPMMTSTEIAKKELLNQMIKLCRVCSRDSGHVPGHYATEQKRLVDATAASCAFAAVAASPTAADLELQAQTLKRCCCLRFGSRCSFCTTHFSECGCSTGSALFFGESTTPRTTTAAA
jgi:hypothetical protein